MEIVAAVIFLLVVLFGVRPYVQKKREEAIAEQIKQLRRTTRSSAEALGSVDELMETTRQEGKTIERTKWIWFLFR